jgi:hypothetical protein
MPGSAMAAGGLAIASASDAGVTLSNGGCTFTANTAGSAARVNVSEIDACLAAGNSVVVDDPNADAGSIDVGTEIQPTSCSGASLTFDEQGGDVDVNTGDSIDLGSCDLELDASTTITQTAVITAGTLTVETGAGAVVLEQNNEIGTLSTGGSGVNGNLTIDNADALTVSNVSDSGGNVNLTAPGITLQGALSDTDGVAEVHLVTNSAGTITETGSGAIDAATLVTSSGSATLNTSGAVNNVATFEAVANTGVVDLSDAEAVSIEITDNGGDVGVTDPGNIDVVTALEAGGQAVSLVSTGGTVSGGGGIGAASLSVTAAAGDVTLPGFNTLGALAVTADDGNVSVNVYGANVSLDNIEASGSVSVDNGDDAGVLQPIGTISGQSIALDADGFTAASGNSALLSAPSISITDTDATDPWTVTPSTLAAEGTGTIAYSGASSLSITGGASFNVTPSALTTMTFNGGDPAAATLTYNAGGRVVSGTTTAPSGTIDGTSVEPVTFSGMTAVTVDDPGTTLPVTTPPVTAPPTTTTPTPTPTPSSNPPTCTLRASSSKIALPKKVHGKLKGKATLTFVATCSGAVHTILSAGITVVWKPAHSKKKKSKFYPIPGVRAGVAANSATKIVLDVPSGAVKALSTKGDTLSVRATLADTDNRDSVLKTTAPTRLK